MSSNTNEKARAGAPVQAPVYMQLRRVVLNYDGPNTVDFPVGGQILGLIQSTDGHPMLVVLAERDGPTEKRDFYRTTGGLPTPGDRVQIGRYVGSLIYGVGIACTDFVFEGVRERGGQ